MGKRFNRGRGPGRAGLAGPDGRPMATSATDLPPASMCSTLSTAGQGAPCMGPACNAFMAHADTPQGQWDAIRDCRWQRGLAALEYVAAQAEQTANGVTDLVNAAVEAGMLTPEAHDEETYDESPENTTPRPMKAAAATGPPESPGDAERADELAQE